jgi:hypothetical protein
VSKLLALSCTLALIALTGACAKSETPVAAAAAPTTPAVTTPAVTTAATSSTAASVTGIAECDQFLSAYEQCVSEKMPEQARAQMQTGLDQWKKSWHDMANNASTKDMLPQMCQQARDSSKPALQAYGCAL